MTHVTTPEPLEDALDTMLETNERYYIVLAYAMVDSLSRLK